MKCNGEDLGRETICMPLIVLPDQSSDHMRRFGGLLMSATSRPSGKQIIERLEARKLPQMVDWFDPLVLGMVAIRTLISSTIGEYADQRPMQEAADGQRDMSRLARRHDYSKTDKSRTPHVV